MRPRAVLRYRASRSAPADPMQQTLANQMADFAVPARPRPFWPHRNGVKDMHAPHAPRRSISLMMATRVLDTRTLAGHIPDKLGQCRIVILDL